MPTRRPPGLPLLALMIVLACGCETIDPPSGSQPARVLVIQWNKSDYKRVKERLEKALDEKKAGDAAGLSEGLAEAKEMVVKALNPSSRHNLSKETIYQFLADRLKDSPPYPELYTAKELEAIESRGRLERKAFPTATANLPPDQYFDALLNPDHIRPALESMLTDWGETAFVVDDVLVRHVSYFAKFFGILDRNETNRTIARSRKYLPRVCEVFSQYALHEDIAFAVPFVESRFTTAACSPAGALGMFQFLASTARDYGLRVESDGTGGNSGVDDRLDWEKSAPAAARYLVRSRNVFASNVLALGAYHHGSMKVVEVLLAIAEKSKERSFRYIFSNDRLDAFSREYVPQCLAAAYLYRWLKQSGLEALPTVPAEYATLKEPLPMAKLVARYGRVQDLNPDLNGADRLYCYAGTGGYALVTKISGENGASIAVSSQGKKGEPVIPVSQSAGSTDQEVSPTGSNAQEQPERREKSPSCENPAMLYMAAGTEDPGQKARQPARGTQGYSLLYTFQKGNSLKELARTFGVPLRVILAHPANRRINKRYPMQPKPGEIVVIPGLAATTTLLTSQEPSSLSPYRFTTSKDQTLRQIAETVTEVLAEIGKEEGAAPEGRRTLSPELILYWNRDLLPPEIGVDDSLPPDIPLFIAADFEAVSTPGQ